MNTFLTILELLLFVTAVVLAYLSWRTSNKSLKEATKARRDMFLPIIKCVENITMLPEGWIRFRNVGNGVAFNVVAALTGVEKSYKLNLLTLAGDPHWKVGLQHSDLRKKNIDDPQLMITYEDIFRRKITTTYKVIQKQVAEQLFDPQLDLDSFDVELPGDD